MRTVQLFVLFVLSVFAVGCGTSAMPGDTALRNGTSFELFSLDPAYEEAIINGEYDGPQFHGWAVLGSTVIEDAATRIALVDALNEAVADKDPHTDVKCFWPRHGIRVIQDGQQHDFLICFKCEKATWFIDGEDHNYIGLTASPKPAFDKVLSEAGVPHPAN